MRFKTHPSGTVVEIEGPKFSSTAESEMFQNDNCSRGKSFTLYYKEKGKLFSLVEWQRMIFIKRSEKILYIKGCWKVLSPTKVPLYHT